MDHDDTFDPLDDVVTRLRGTLDAPGQPLPGDEALVAGMAKQAAAAAAAPAAGLSLLAKLGLVGGSAGVMVAALVVMQPSPDAAAPRAPTAAAIQAAEPEVAPTPLPEAAPVEPEVTSAAKDDDHDTSRRAAPDLGPAELLRLANQARRDGDTRTAMRRYRKILRRYPDSREAATATIARGWLQLGKLSRPADSIKSFEAYLARHPRGSLAPEAAAGIARAWKALGDHKRERAAWKSLLERFPKSIYAGEAHKRLGEGQ